MDSKGVKLRVSIKVEIPRRGGHWILGMQKHVKRKIRDKFWLLVVSTICSRPSEN